jgi:nucleotide-binding universal stress UspA family protein
MVVRSILIPTDFSETSDEALKYAADMALAFGGRLHVMHVQGKAGDHFAPNFPAGLFVTAVQEKLRTFLSREEIDRLRLEYAVRVGGPAEEIVRDADARAVDVIVMGTHGRSGIAHLLMGSVAEQVVRMAPCPVLLIRHPKYARVSSPVAAFAVDDLLRTPGCVPA